MLITRENAVEMAKRSAAARKARIERESAEQQTEQKTVALTLDAATEYIGSRLMRVRKQLDRIDDMLLDEEDPQKLDRLASASAKLAEQERQLAGRPLPGSFRPSAPRKSAHYSAQVAPIAEPSDTESDGQEPK